MRERVFDPRRLDVAAFARDAARLQGEWPLSALERLAASQQDGAPPGRVVWSATGSLEAGTGGVAVPWLRLCGHVILSLECQRCLQPLPERVEVDTRFRFADDEDQAARLDAESAEDVLALTRDLDLMQLLEDELLLALPLVPRHTECPEPLPAPNAEFGEGEPAAHPFAALAGLRKPPG